MKFFNDRFGRAVSCLLVLAAVSVASFGQKLGGNHTVTDFIKSGPTAAPNALVSAIKFDGNVSCKNLNDLQAGTQPPGPWSHIITDYELKLDFASPTGTFPFTPKDAPMPREVVGPQSATATVTINSGQSEVFSWSSTRQITAVILKIGNNSYAYSYKPFSQGDADLDPSDFNGLSHVSFCFADPTGPTAGEAAINGRVVGPSGNGISKAQMVLVNGATGETKITMTNPFGYYTFVGLDVNELYVLNVAHKRFSFAEPQRTVSLTDSFTTVDFVAEP